MTEYQQTQTIDASAGEVFAWLSDVNNLPQYLPPVVDASIEGASAQGSPGHARVPGRSRQLRRRGILRRG
jgi:ribosome-associated toxin RatA of RatAB toxin-antitoxin module